MGVPVFCGDLVPRPVDVRQQGGSAGVGAATGALVGLATVFYVSPQVPLGAVAVAALETFVFLLCVHLHEMLQGNRWRE